VAARRGSAVPDGTNHIRKQRLIEVQMFNLLTYLSISYYSGYSLRSLGSLFVDYDVMLGIILLFISFTVNSLFIIVMLFKL
jgi:hypothetical protein